jgi:hypothetical protein
MDCGLRCYRPTVRFYGAPKEFLAGLSLERWSLPKGAPHQKADECFAALNR